ncbi:hypothetical protein CCACVL1_27368 [Corchorus capsularis]|uniref:Uncharacterized protein n=1 Tax=Corchorus capsularis TaxID=210143 RepID=A0A1R3GAS0_COCAP|nr:hypothetical protein CCACVL1_27368 [Corchorus capsularis]
MAPKRFPCMHGNSSSSNAETGALIYSHDGPQISIWTQVSVQPH